MKIKKMIGRKIYDLENVFGQTRDLPLNYVERDSVDTIFKESLDRNKHVVVYGSSKQGKTSLRKKNLNESDYISVHCSNKWEIENLNTQILKQAGFELTASTSKTFEGKAKVSASYSFMKLFEGGAEVEGGGSKTKNIEPLELDPTDVNDIIEALESIKFEKFIVLEDFHYLKDEVQRDFSIELKAFHENSKFTFIVIGVWLDENKLIQLNGDLNGRVYSVNADRWTDEELRSVVKKGEDLLNVKFDKAIIEEILKWNVNSVFQLQESCYRILKTKGIKETQKDLFKVENDIDVYQLIKDLIYQQTGRYKAFMEAVKLGFQVTELEMHKWLLYPILDSTTEKRLDGYSYRELKEKIMEKHPRGKDLNAGNLTLALNSISSLQIKKNITPNILDYDKTNSVLKIVDRGFIVWLIFQENENLIKELGIE